MKPQHGLKTQHEILIEEQLMQSHGPPMASRLQYVKHGLTTTVQELE